MILLPARSATMHRFDDIIDEVVIALTFLVLIFIAGRYYLHGGKANPKCNVCYEMRLAFRGEGEYEDTWCEKHKGGTDESTSD